MASREQKLLQFGVKPRWHNVPMGKLGDLPYAVGDTVILRSVFRHKTLPGYYYRDRVERQFTSLCKQYEENEGLCDLFKMVNCEGVVEGLDTMKTLRHTYTLLRVRFDGHTDCHTVVSLHVWPVKAAAQEDSSLSLPSPPIPPLPPQQLDQALAPAPVPVKIKTKLKLRLKATTCDSLSPVTNPNPPVAGRPKLRPFLRWTGSKIRTLDTVFRHFPSVIHNYYEPFLGGGSVLLHLLQKIESGEIRLTGKICVSDANPELINTYECVKSHPEALVAHLNKLITEFENADDMDAKKAFFKMQQYIFNKFKVRGIHGIRGIHRSEEASAFTDVIMAATFIFINKTCFRGVYREGKSGDFITPFFYPFNGGVTILDAESVRRTSELYRKYDVSFTTCNYPELINIENSPRVAVVADFVYLDPPYVKLTKSSFVEYVKEGFDDAEFNVWLEELSTTTRLIVNNYATEETLKQFEEWPLTMCYRVSKDANRELLAANFI